MTNRGTKLVVALGMLFVIAVPIRGAHAAGLYVRDGVSAAIREFPYDNSKVTAMAQANDYLEIFEGRGEWLKVKTPKGEEGWIQNRFLTRTMPKKLVIDQLNEKIKALTEENTALQEENAQLQRDSRERNYKMSGFSKDLEDARRQYDTLKQESSRYLELKGRYDTLQAQFRESADKMDQLKRENGRLKTSERLIFTLVGGGFIIIGLVIGTLLQFLRGKPKKAGYKF